MGGKLRRWSDQTFGARKAIRFYVRHSGGIAVMNVIQPPKALPGTLEINSKQAIGEAMKNRILKMRGSILIILVWILVWCLVTTNHIAPLFSGTGVAHIGNEYYRYFTAGLTHTNLIRLLANVCAMFWVGYLYEQHIGSVRLVLIGAACAVVSQIIFLCIYRDTLQSVSGSAYNFALCGFGLVMSFLTPGFPKLQLGTWSGNWLILYLIVSNIPVLSFMNATTIIFHLVSFVAGAAAAFIGWILGLKKSN